MPLFRRKESLEEEFLTVYSQVHQYTLRSNGNIPPALRIGIAEATMQREIQDWARTNAAIIESLVAARSSILSGRASAAQLKPAIAQAKTIIATLEARLAQLGRQS